MCHLHQGVWILIWVWLSVVYNSCLVNSPSEGGNKGPLSPVLVSLGLSLHKNTTTMTTPYFTKKFVEPSLYRGYTVLKVHVQSKVRKKSNTHCYWLLSFVLGVEQYSDCKIELPLLFPPLAYQLNLQSIIHRNHYLLLSIWSNMVLITQHLITLCIIEESLDMICPFSYLPPLPVLPALDVLLVPPLPVLLSAL